MKGRNPFARMLAGFFPGRKVKAGVMSRFNGGAVGKVEVDRRSGVVVASDTFGTVTGGVVWDESLARLA